MGPLARDGDKIRCGGIRCAAFQSVGDLPHSLGDFSLQHLAPTNGHSRSLTTNLPVDYLRYSMHYMTNPWLLAKAAQRKVPVSYKHVIFEQCVAVFGVMKATSVYLAEIFHHPLMVLFSPAARPNL